MPRPGEKCKVALVIPVVLILGIGASTMLSLREHVKAAEEKFFSIGYTGAMPRQLQEKEAAPVAPVTRHRSIR